MNKDSKLIYEAYYEAEQFDLPFQKHLSYMESIKSKLDEARERAVTEIEDPSEKDSLSRGHGIYKGTCDHVIKQCRCMRHHEPIIVDVLCQECSKKS